jgi:hypothetical protein
MKIISPLSVDKKLWFLSKTFVIDTSLFVVEVSFPTRYHLPDQLGSDDDIYYRNRSRYDGSTTFGINDLYLLGAYNMHDD